MDDKLIRPIKLTYEFLPNGITDEIMRQVDFLMESNGYEE